MNFRPIGVMALVLVAAASGVGAQQTSPEDSTRAALIQMKSDLRNLVVAQEKYYSEHAAYASSIDQLAYRPSRAVSPRLTVTQNYAWAAEARSEVLPTVKCSIFINLAEALRPKGAYSSKAAEGEPYCDLIADTQR